MQELYVAGLGGLNTPACRLKQDGDLQVKFHIGKRTGNTRDRPDTKIQTQALRCRYIVMGLCCVVGERSETIERSHR